MKRITFLMIGVTVLAAAIGTVGLASPSARKKTGFGSSDMGVDRC